MSAMYLQHFGLAQAPFSITPNPAFFYSGHERGDMLAALLYAVTHGEGIVKVTGEVGTGKTMLCRMLEHRLPAHIDAIYLVNPSLGPDDVLYAIAAELGLDARDWRADEVLRRLNGELIARHAQGRQVVLLVEEAQAMPLETLEAVRLLTNLETAREKLLQIVLFGQPELDEHLALPRMRQLAERITHSFFVPPLPPRLVAAFLQFRLRAAGYTGGPLFSQAAVRLIARSSGGIVRRINILADKALMAAFADDAVTVTARHARQAIAEAPFRAARAGAGARAWLALGLGACALAALSVWAASAWAATPLPRTQLKFDRIYTMILAIPAKTTVGIQ
jgi:type II secretory pathway predicted ATPase ExeA